MVAATSPEHRRCCMGLWRIVKAFWAWLCEDERPAPSSVVKQEPDRIEHVEKKPQEDLLEDLEEGVRGGPPPVPCQPPVQSKTGIDLLLAAYERAKDPKAGIIYVH